MYKEQGSQYEWVSDFLLFVSRQPHPSFRATQKISAVAAIVCYAPQSKPFRVTLRRLHRQGPTMSRRKGSRQRQRSCLNGFFAMVACPLASARGILTIMGCRSATFTSMLAIYTCDAGPRALIGQGCPVFCLARLHIHRPCCLASVPGPVRLFQAAVRPAARGNK